MRDDANRLKFTTKEVLSRFTHALQMENGLIFYIKMHYRELYVKYCDEEIEAKFPEGFGDTELSRAAVHGNALYFETNRKIYNVAFSTPGVLRLSYVREQLEGEHCFRYAMCARTIGSHPFFYRLCDHPNKDIIAQGITAAEKEGLVAICIHRKKLVYITQKQDDLSAHAHERSNNEVFIQIPHSPPFEASYSQDSSPFFYIANRESLFAVNTVTMEMLPPLYLGGASFYYIVGVHNGVITLMDQGKKWQLISAQLPEGYYDITTFYDEEKAERHRTGWKIKEFFGNLFRKSPSPEQTEVDNNANVIQPEKEQGSATMEKLADSMYLAFKSSVKMSDNFNGEATEFSSKFFNEFTFKQLRGSGGSGCVFEVSSKSDKCAYAVKRIAVAVEELDNAQEEVFTMAQFEHPGFVKYSCIWVEKPPKGWQRQMRFEDGGGSGGEKLVGDCYWSNSYQLRADFENLKELESSRNFRDDDVFIYIQMKLYKKSLADWLVENQTDSSRPISLVSSWFKQLVSAVWYLHDNDIIHSDLKPSNILIDNMNRLVLCTLGKVMKRKIGFEDESTSSRQKNCSLLYMSPEQSSILPRFTFKTDIFALGLILAEMSVVIRNDEERYELFDAYREGEPPNHIFDDEETAEFVAWLADKSSRKRPTCSEILIHPFLRSDG